MKKTNRILSLIMALVMMLSAVFAVNITAFADDLEETYINYVIDTDVLDLGDSAEIIGFLMDNDGGVVQNAKINAKNGSEEFEVYTNKHGYFDFSYTPKVLGNQELRLEYAGDETHQSCYTVIGLNVLQRDEYIVETNIPASLKASENLVATVRVLYPDKTPVVGITVIIGLYYSGFEYCSSGKTNEKGEFTGSVQDRNYGYAPQVTIFVPANDICSSYNARYDILLTNETAYRMTVKTDGKGGSVQGSTVYVSGATATLTATEDEYGMFLGWFEGETKVSDDKAYSFTANSNRTLTAKFKEVACLHEKDAASYINAVAKKEATCTENGYEAYYKCSSCENLFLDANGNERIAVPTVITAKGHSPAEMVFENGIAATCTENGSFDEVIYCADCKTELSRQTIILNKLGHDYKKVVTKPTCTKKGYTTHTCKTCGDSYVDNYVKAHGHEWNNGKVTKKATPTATGVKTYKCIHCKTTKQVTIKKCEKYKNTMVVKGKKVSVKFSSLKKKNKSIARKDAISVNKAKGKVTYKKKSGNKKIKVSSSGKITVGKGLKKGKYEIKVQVMAAGTNTYKSKTKTVTVTITVK